MPRINLIQAINLNIIIKDRATSLQLVKGINEVPAEVLGHPYIQAHMKAGSVSIVPDPADPEVIAAAARKIADEAEAAAAAARQVKKDKEEKDAADLAAAKAENLKPAAAVSSEPQPSAAEPAPATLPSTEAPATAAPSAEAAAAAAPAV